MTGQPANEESASALVKYLLDKGLGGFPPLSSATDLADGYLIDQGNTQVDEATLRRVHMQGYETTVAAGVATVNV